MQLRLLALWVLAAATAGASVTEKFYEQLTPEERRAAGVADLTPEQQAALSALADRWVEAKTEPAVAAARQKAAAEVRAKVEAERKASAGLAPKADAPENEIIRTRIAGTFKQWGPGTRFELENGQVWVADRHSDGRYFGPMDRPEVELRPASFGFWKLYLMPDGLWIRVKRIQ